MLEEVFRPADWPQCEVRLKPLTGPSMLDLQRSNMGGDAVYAAFIRCATDWKNAPLIGGGAVGFDRSRDVVENLLPSFVLDCVVHALRMSTLTDDERKNSSSQSTSEQQAPTTASDAPAETDS